MGLPDLGTNANAFDAADFKMLSSQSSPVTYYAESPCCDRFPLATPLSTRLPSRTARWLRDQVRMHVAIFPGKEQR
jgi:hypothetical protein